MSMLVTILFATRNGSETLSQMLERFTQLRLLNSSEIIAVDNGSDDRTPEILSTYQKRLPIRILNHPIAGKNRALNQGLKEARGDLIILTDDDVIPEVGWIEAYVTEAQNRPDYSIFGGRIVPNWPRVPDQWFLDEVPLGVTYAITNEQLDSGPVSPEFVWGPNMCVHRRVFDAGLEFCNSVGPGPGQYIMGSETEFTRRAVGKGFMCWHVAEAVVQHLVRPHQLDPAWVVRRAFRAGRSQAHELACPSEEVAMLLGVPRWLIKSWASDAALAWWYRQKGKTQLWLRHAWRREFKHGVLYQLASESSNQRAMFFFGDQRQRFN